MNDTSPSSQTVTLEPHLEGLRSRSELIYEDGRKIVTETAATLDGTQTQLLGDGHYDTVSVELVDEKTLKMTSMKGRLADRSSRWFISSDGRRMMKIQRVVSGRGGVKLTSL